MKTDDDETADSVALLSDVVDAVLAVAAELTADDLLLPFGLIEDPTGRSEPPGRGEPFSVWAFSEIHRSALALEVSGGHRIRLPTVAGYTAAKLAAWLDRKKAQDVADVALAHYWYATSDEVERRLYAEESATLLAEDLHVGRAAAHLLGVDVARTIGKDRHAELLGRWTPVPEAVVAAFQLAAGPVWPGERGHRRELIDAFTRGLTNTGPVLSW